MSETNQASPGMAKKISRRTFLGGTTAAAAAFTIVPRRVLGGPGYQAPSDTLNIACVGVGGKGESDIESVSKENIVALCDVDDTQVVKKPENKDDRTALERYERLIKVPRYRDFRIMLEKEKTIDAVVVSTPDHTHAVIAMMAMQMGKHVFVQKPLTHTILEARKLTEAARKYGVVTQMGNQGHAEESSRLICEWLWDGAIGPVREVHVWTNRPIWPQGIDRPKEIPSLPPTLDWTLWLGPAPYRPYHPAYAPFSWRGWWDFGTGALGDMGAHIIDQPYWALKLGAPTKVFASSTPFNNETYPLASLVTWEFPARENMPPVKMTWYDGGLTPPRPEELEPGRKMGDGGGVIFVGDKGKLMCSTYGSNPRLIPEAKMREYKRPEKTIPRSPGIHEEWIEAIKTGKPATTNFDYSGPLTEAMMLGNLALRMADKNTVLEWDAKNLKVTNLPEAEEFLHFTYSPGWSL